MPYRYKGFTLIELMVAVAVLVIVVTIAVPSFTTLYAKIRADTETGDFYRALNVARLEAINRGVSVQLAAASATTWAGALTVKQSSAGTVLRVLPAMASSSTMTPGTSTAYVEFNNLGAMVNPSAALVFTYVNGSVTRYVVVCPNGRSLLNNGSSC